MEPAGELALLLGKFTHLLFDLRVARCAGSLGEKLRRLLFIAERETVACHVYERPRDLGVDVVAHVASFQDLTADMAASMAVGNGLPAITLG
jgi:hypothetical protein